MENRHIRPLQPDARLSAALQMLGECRLFADIGADHGRLSAAALSRGQAERALISDVSDKALMKARALIARMGLEARATFAVADGLTSLEALKGDSPDAIFILGMGGDTVSGILRRGKDALCGAALIMSAHTDIPELRKAVCDIGYRICEERAVKDGGRFYTLMKCLPARLDEPPYTEEELLLGAGFLKELSPDWLPLLERQRRLLMKGIAAMETAARQKDAERLIDFKRELKYVTGAIERVREANGDDCGRRVQVDGCDSTLRDRRGL